MTKTNRLIPQNKFDTSTIKQLERIKTEQISTISMQLLEWIADMNWPVAQELIKVLPRFHKELMIDIKYILSDKVDDSIWKYWIISQLLIQFPKEGIINLLPIIQEYADSVPNNEDEDDLKKSALDFLDWYNKKENSSITNSNPTE